MSLSLHAIAQSLGGRVCGDKVVAPGPEAASKKGYKRRKRTLTVWINGDGDIGVNSWRGQDPIATKDWVRARCGLPAWAPKKRKPKPLSPLWGRNQFLAESLKVARDRKRITFEQFALIINDLKNASPGENLKSRAAVYAQEFGFTAARIEAAMHPEWRSYTAAERAGVFKITYDEYRRLGLRRSGCIELDPAQRRCLTKQRYNAKRRDERAAKRASKSADYCAPLCPSWKVGTVRVPSSEAVVGLVESRDRDSEMGLIEAENFHGEIGAFAKETFDRQHGRDPCRSGSTRDLQNTRQKRRKRRSTSQAAIAAAAQIKNNECRVYEAGTLALP